MEAVWGDPFVLLPPCTDPPHLSLTHLILENIVLTSILLNYLITTNIWITLVRERGKVWDLCHTPFAMLCRVYRQHDWPLPSCEDVYEWTNRPTWLCNSPLDVSCSSFKDKCLPKMHFLDTMFVSNLIQTVNSNTKWHLGDNHFQYWDYYFTLETFLDDISARSTCNYCPSQHCICLLH